MTDAALVDGEYEAELEWRGMILSDSSALIAASFPVKPSSDWFANPGLKALTPLTITSGGQVYGHIAAWHTSHIGMAGGVKPPKSRSDYAFFRTGAVECDNGDIVNVGQITLAGGHASLSANAAQAVAHYDNTDSAVMDVAAGEDKYGIWVAGALRPDVTDSQVRSMRASSVSGDWRPINGKLELVAVCAVNCPGFPIPRSRVAGGQPMALVAAGVGPIIDRTIEIRAGQDVEAGIEAGLSIFRERIQALEKVILARGIMDVEVDEPVVSDAAPVAPPAQATDSADKMANLRKRIHKAPAADAAAPAPKEAPAEDAPVSPATEAPANEPTPNSAEDHSAKMIGLRGKVHSPKKVAKPDAAKPDAAAVAASLRDKMHPQAVYASGYNAEETKKLIKAGQTFDKSGSYPIANAEDLGKAIHAVGRGNANHDALRKYIIGRAKALGKSNMIPTNWSADGSIKK